MGGSKEGNSGPARRKKYPARAHLEAVLARLGGKVNDEIILIKGGSLIRVGSSDQFYEFIQESNFYYLTGYGEPESTLLYDGSKRETTLLVPPLREGREIAYLPQRDSVDLLRRNYDFDRVFYSNHFPIPADCILFPDLTPRHSRVFEASISTVPTGPRIQAECWDVSARSTVLDDSIESVEGIDTNGTSIADAVIECRSIKDSTEIKLISKASQISCSAHRAVAKRIGSVETEKDLELIFTTFCVLNGGKRQAYTPIFASGQNASVLHYTHNSAPLYGRELILVDAACCIDGYASDVTRTYPLSSTHFSPLARRLYTLVLDLQLLAIENVWAGNSIASINNLVHDLLSEKIVEYEWINCDVQTCKEFNLSKAFLMHGLGHHIGLDVHDPQPLHEQLRPGNVITIEPGVYFNQEFLDTFYDDEKVGQYFNKHVIKQWSHLGGVRIEDVVLVTESGCRVLTELGKTVEEVEAMCA